MTTPRKRRVRRSADCLYGVFNIFGWLKEAHITRAEARRQASLYNGRVHIRKIVNVRWTLPAKPSRKKKQK